MTATSGTGHPRALALWQILLLVVLGLRVIGFAATWSRSVLNMDFSAYYMAGKALNRGLDPYRNHVAGPTNESLWDGVCRYRYSRFLYPPLIAQAFRPVARLPFATAKALWTAGELAALLVGLTLFARTARQPLAPALLLALASHPLLAHLERGQIDLFTLVLLGVTLRLLVSPARRRRPWLAGGCLALATMVKLSCFLIVPFLALRRRWRAVGGFAAGFLVLLAVDWALNGQLTGRYYRLELPRIVRFGQEGSPDQLLPEEQRGPIDAALARGVVAIDGVPYRVEGMRFAPNASLTRAVARRFCRNCPALSLVVLGLLLGIATVLAGKAFFVSAGPASEVPFFLVACTTALLVSPMTWTMNTVWLFPTMLLVSAEMTDNRSLPTRHPLTEVGLAAAVLGLILLAVPDHLAFPLALPAAWTRLLGQKYVAAELLLFLACCLAVRLQGHRSR